MKILGAGTLWTRCDLDAVANLEDLDARLDAVLDMQDPATAGAVGRLAAWLAIEPWALHRLAGVPIAADVANARLHLIGAARNETLRRAEALKRGDDARGLRHALAVCAAMQWEVLGDVAASALAFACRDRPRLDAVLLAAAVREAAPRGSAVVLHRIRRIAIAGGAVEAAAAIAC
jgi:hypothetical protein